LETEHDNLRAALDYALEEGSVALAGRVAAAAWTFWKLRSHVSEGRDRLRRVLAAADESGVVLPAEVLIGAGDLAIDQGDVDEAQIVLERARALADSHGDAHAAASAVAKLASLPHKAGDLETAVARGEEALALARAAGDDWVVGRVLPSLALLREDQGDHARATDLADEAVAVGRRSGNPYVIADAALSAGEIALNREDLKAAERLFGEALANAETAGIGDVGAWSLAYLGKLAVARGDHRRAQGLLGSALQQFHDLESPMGASWTLCHLGRALQGEGQLDAARRRLEEALELALAYVRPDAPIAIEALGQLAVDAGEPERAAVLLGAAEGIRTRIGLEPAPPERRAAEAARARLGRTLGDERMDEVTARGRAMSTDEAADYARRRD
jgi:tetratricopeptide (TPR) repeat protein